MHSVTPTNGVTIPQPGHGVFQIPAADTRPMTAAVVAGTFDTDGSSPIEQDVTAIEEFGHGLRTVDDIETFGVPA